MDTKDQFSTPAKLQLAGQIPVKFETPDAFLTELKAEIQFLDDLRSRQQANDTVLNQGAQVTRNQIDGIIGRFNQLASQTSEEASYKRLITEYAAANPLPSSSAPALFISKLGETDPAFALRAVVCWAKARIQLGQSPAGPEWIRAGSLCEMLQRGWQKNLDSLGSSLASLASEWDARFETVNADQNGLIGRQVDLSEKFSDLLKTETDRADAAAAQHDRDVSEAIQNGIQQIEAIRETYKAELTLQAPTTYWREKQIAHRKISAGWILAFVCVAGACCWAVWIVWSITAAKHLLDRNPPSYGFFLPTVGASFLAVWVLRIISRQIISNLGLSSDAGERVAMVKTFLALMQKPDHVKEPDRVLILSALFRSTSSTSDDAAPPSWFDLVMQRIDAK